MSDGRVKQGQTARVRALVPNYGGLPLTKADIKRIELKLFDVTGVGGVSARLVFEGFRQIDTTVFDTLQLPADWDENTDGFNFEDFVSGQLLSRGGAKYKAEYFFYIERVTPDDTETYIPLEARIITESMEGL